LLFIFFRAAVRAAGYGDVLTSLLPPHNEELLKGGQHEHTKEGAQGIPPNQPDFLGGIPVTQDAGEGLVGQFRNRDDKCHSDQKVENHLRHAPNLPLTENELAMLSGIREGEHASVPR
jgi:hypothetical protein